jgi:integrase
VGEYGHLPLAAIRKAHVREWMAKRAAAGRGRNTIRNELAPVRAALEQAVEDKKLTENPATISRRGKQKALPGREPKKVVAPPADQVTATIAAAEGDFKVVLLTAVSSGLRLGELYALRWDDIADDWRTLTVARSNRRGVITDPKTEAGSRTVPIFPTLRKALKEHKVASRFTGPQDLVFPDPLGRPENPFTVAHRELRAALKAAGLEEKAFTFHSLRHFAVSRLIEDGANILLVSKIAGHASADITLKVYAHLMSDGADKAADAFDPAVSAIG